MRKDPFAPRGRLLKTILIDFLALAVCLNGFSYFHHVRVRDVTPTAVGSLPTAAAQAAQTTAAPDEPQMQDASEAPAAEETDAALASDVSAAPVADGMFGAQFADRFAASGTEQTETSYRSANLSVEIQTKQFNTSTYYVADLYVRDLSCLRTAVALDYKSFNTESRKNVMQVGQLSDLAGGVLAISGDNFVYRNAGVLAIRNGLEWAKKTPITDDICVLLADGTMETFSSKSSAAWRTYLDALYARNPYQVWCFGPSLLDESGKAKASFNSSVTAENPRAAIGFYEPGHYCFVLVDGRQAGYSIGLKLDELSQVFEQLGCKAAYNLDGGDTVAMTFFGKLVNHPEEAQPRSTSDIILVCEPQTQTAATADGEG